MMSTIDLIVLGILLKSPMNAFELVRYIDEKQIGKLLKISNTAVYKCCKRLFKADLVSGKTVREGEMPEKVIYSVNEKGVERFRELMEHFSSNLTPFYFEFNSFIWNIEHVEITEGLEMLNNLRNELILFKDWIVDHEKELPLDSSYPARTIVKQYRMMIITLLTWIEESIADYKGSHVAR